MGQQVPDEIVYEILLRLPVKSIFRFKSVSKDWNSLLSDLQFRRQYLARSKDAPSPLLGFFQFRLFSSFIHHTKDQQQQSQVTGFNLSFLPTCDQGVPLNSHDFTKKLGHYYASSGSFILCGHHPSNYYFCNPVTDQWFKLPPPNVTTGFFPRLTIGFYCEQQLDHLRYKVVRAECTQSSVGGFKIETYSSETGVWRESRIIGPWGILLSGDYRCLAMKGTFFWTTCCKNIVAYDPDTAEDRFLFIRRPPIHRPLWNPVLGLSPEGRLQCAKHDDVDVGFRIYVLKKKLSCYRYYATLEVSEWNLSHVVRLQIPNILPDHYRLASRPVAFHPHNSGYLYLRLWDGIYLCDTWSGRVDLVPHQSTQFPIDIFPYFLPKWPLSPLLRTSPVASENGDLPQEKKDDQKAMDVPLIKSIEGVEDYDLSPSL